MIRESKMSSNIYKLSAFPLHVIVLPGEEIPLRIFEPRYKQLITESLESSSSFGIPYIDGENEITNIGSEVEIVKLVDQNDSGDMVITIKGKALYEILDFFPVLPDKLYGGSIAKTLNHDLSTTNPEIAVKVKKLKLNIDSKLGTLIISDSLNLLDIAKTLMLKPSEKYRFITLVNKSDREQFIINYLNFMELIRAQELKLEDNFQLN
ncbi:MAG TPA: LON peptidase substrate-binding domain-containing protein [Perlabentimonas sp.]|nr:LON peptidase substrate-binding domain-containing protein [Bacteroidales bacterium]MDD4673183.1 LON peptidase substrate-binding domain-containing protein [Bacteroidales bacterium]HZJ73361.1 LON peptidase substrate-binding domain-containing protein [Perlabentimonas sp.]